MSEKDLQNQVLEYAKLRGWRTAHFTSSVRVIGNKGGGYRFVGDRSSTGFPDLVLVRGPRLVFAELKGEKGKPSPAQVEWYVDLRQLEAATDERVQVFLWRPSDWDTIQEVLK